QEGMIRIIRASGNPAEHVVLRGRPACGNYDPQSSREAETRLIGVGLAPVLMVDCSQANSGKQHARQEEVWRSVIGQRAGGAQSLIGVMLESYLSEGNQPFPKKVSELRSGISITDACLGWEATERMLRWGHEQLARC